MKDCHAIAAVFTSSLAVKAIAFLLEAKDKRAYLTLKYGSLGPEETSGIFSTSFVFWASGLLLNGNKSILSLETLSPIDSRMHSWKLEKDFNNVWEKCMYNYPLNCRLEADKSSIISN
jgi:ATP-binding cassette subfamily C (CFTR/MRP) protein 1